MIPGEGELGPGNPPPAAGVNNGDGAPAPLAGWSNEKPPPCPAPPSGQGAGATNCRLEEEPRYFSKAAIPWPTDPRVSMEDVDGFDDQVDRPGSCLQVRLQQEISQRLEVTQRGRRVADGRHSLYARTGRGRRTRLPEARART